MGKFNLNEMPRRIISIDDSLGFDNTKNNTELASKIIKSSKSHIIKETNFEYVLYKYGNKFILIDPFRLKVLYYLKWENNYIKFLNTTVSKIVLHWRHRGLMDTKNISSDVFFNLLLPINNSIMSDNKQTESGERFWIRTIEEAYDKNLNVYLLNILPTNKSNKKSLLTIKDKFEFQNLIINDELRFPWGNEKKFEARRLIISSNILKEPV